MTDGADTLRDDPLLGRVLDNRYEVRTPLGSGGMGAVYRGWQRSVEREVAIKVIEPTLASNRDVVKRFLREARLASRLSAPTIVAVYDFGQTDDNTLYIVMELLRGRTLADELGRGALGLVRTIDIGIQLCDALEAAHAAGIIHRDLKPTNIVILDEPAGRPLVKVLDFGLAKSLGDDGISLVTHRAALIGTPLYMSPERIQGQPSDPRADLYSLGCILHEMSSGTSPFGANTIDRILSNHLYELSAPLPPGVPPRLAELIRRSIAKDPAERPSSASEIRTALVAIRAEAAAPARSHRRRWWIGAVAVLGIGAIVTAISVVANRGDSAPAVVDAARAVDADRLVDAAAGSAIDAIDATAAAIDATAIDAARADARSPARHAARPVDAVEELDFYGIDASR